MRTLPWRAALLAELEAWQRMGAAATFWWRDDDAQQPSEALLRLLRLREKFRLPLALAVIPVGMDCRLQPVLAAPAVEVLVHGYRHANHAPAAEKRQELGRHRPAERIIAELQRAWQQIGALFGAAARPILVPPWNRIDPGLYARLIDTGFLGLSTFGARRQPLAAQSGARELVQVNTHVDLIDWKQGRCFAGERAVTGQLLRHLQARRQRTCDPDEPTGLLTHHLVHDARSWRFLAALFALMEAHPAVEWVGAGRAFGLKRGG